MTSKYTRKPTLGPRKWFFLQNIGPKFGKSHKNLQGENPQQKLPIADHFPNHTMLNHLAIISRLVWVFMLDCVPSMYVGVAEESKRHVECQETYFHRSADSASVSVRHRRVSSHTIFHVVLNECPHRGSLPRFKFNSWYSANKYVCTPAKPTCHSHKCQDLLHTSNNVNIQIAQWSMNSWIFHREQVNLHISITHGLNLW